MVDRICISSQSVPLAFSPNHLYDVGRQHLAVRDKTCDLCPLVHTGVITVTPTILCLSPLMFLYFVFTLAECTVLYMESHHGQIDVGGVQLQVDLPVDGGLAVLVEVLSHLRSHFSGTTKTSESL